MQWWERAYLDDEGMRERFFIEAESALPLVSAEARDMEGIFQALQYQRAKLRAGQQLGEWGA